MAEECIHGFEAGFCDACYPKARPEVAPAAVVTKTRVTRPRTASLTAPRRPLSAAAAAVPVDDVSQQRLYHVTHIRNLPSILATGGLLADASEAWVERPEVEISSPETRALRRSIVVSDDDGASVASYVPFFLSPVASAWDSIRTRAADPRLSLERDTVAADYVLLVTSVKTIQDSLEGQTQDAAIVITDGDAAHALTRFETTPDAGDRVLRKLRADEESGRILAAELLVKESISFDVISLIAVANDKARNAVKDILKGSGHGTRVSIHPPWFQAGE